MWMCTYLIHARQHMMSEAGVMYAYLREASASLPVPTVIGNARASTSGNGQMIMTLTLFVSILFAKEVSPAALF